MDRALSSSSFIRPSKEHLDQAHIYIIQNVALALEVPKNSITPSLRWIAHGPSSDVATYYSYMINGYYYHTKRHDDIRRVQNNGVSITATTMQVSSSKDKNPIMSDMTFYGVIQEIWEIDYHQLSFILFKCDWVDNRSGVKVDKLGFTIVDLKLVLTSPQRTIEEDFFEDEIGDMLQECGYGTIQSMPNVDTPNETYIIHDCEGRWVEKVRNITAIFMMEDSSKDEREMLPEDELVATHKNEDILTDTLGSKEHGGRVRVVGGFVSQSQYFNTVKGKEKMITPQVEICHEEKDDSRCKSQKKRSNRSR
ncbi:transposase [Cucumis melo var. makuwa]|uniref:Transposase n=1 Tax=Cucumis melo var. makuwa TaxID=1194695 RepID=A0A5A7VE73_CUCMM|nr:transposase [Cucumis melo var. makuwa]TYK28869.1 transposase [Cucumis melo var. makuwa]